MMERTLSTLNEMMGRKTNSTPSFIKSDGLFITKPFDVAKLLGVTLDCKLSWSKHIDSMVVKMARVLSVIKRCSDFLTPH